MIDWCQLVVTHPGMVCHGTDSPRCRTDALGNIPTEKSRGSATCGCDPDYAEYSEEDAKWKAEPGLHQQVVSHSSVFVSVSVSLGACL